MAVSSLSPSPRVRPTASCPRPRDVVQPLIVDAVRHALADLFGVADDAVLTRDAVARGLQNHGVSVCLDARRVADHILTTLRPYQLFTATPKDDGRFTTNPTLFAHYLLYPLPYPSGPRFAQAFLDHVLTAHPALTHPYLDAISHCSLPNARHAVLHFAHNYSVYSCSFVSNLEVVLSKLRSGSHVAALRADAAEESGQAVPDAAELAAAGIEREWVDGVSHAVLFRRFADAVESAIDKDTLAFRHNRQRLANSEHGRRFAADVSDFLRRADTSEVAAVGALAIGTEAVVRPIYQHVFKAVTQSFPELAPRDTVFFPLHIAVDDAHAATLLTIATHVTERAPRRSCAELIRGALHVLDLRERLWDALLADAELFHPDGTDGRDRGGMCSSTPTPAKPASNCVLYNRQAAAWVRKQPSCLSDFTGRPAVVDMLQPLAGKTVLDVGCGEGYLARTLRRDHAVDSVTGIDLSPAMIAAARAEETSNPLGNLTFLPGDARALTQLVRNCSLLAARPGVALADDANDVFDSAVACFVFNYMTVADMTRVMGQVHELLKPGGQFVFSVPHPSLPFWQAQHTKKREGEKKGAPAPFAFDPMPNGYFDSVDHMAEGSIQTLDGRTLNVRCFHKRTADYFSALRNAGFTDLPDVRELGVTPDLLRQNPAFFRPLDGKPLHMAFAVRKGALDDSVRRSPQIFWPRDAAPSVADVTVRCPREASAELRAMAFGLLDNGFDPDSVCSADVPRERLVHASELASHVAGRLAGRDGGHGAVLVKSLFDTDSPPQPTDGAGALDEDTVRRMAYFVFATLMGRVERDRGALWDVFDRGLDVTEPNVLFSASHSAAPFHTDGSRRELFPDVVGLMCVRPHAGHGTLVLANACNAYHALRQRLDPAVFQTLRMHRVVHDRITSGLGKTRRGLDLSVCSTAADVLTSIAQATLGDDAVARLMTEANIDPIFNVQEQSSRTRMRYMRDWITRGYDICGIDLPDPLRQAMDALDDELEHGVTIRHELQRGDVVFTNNHIIPHMREAFPAHSQRRMVRVWIDIPL